MTYQRRSNLSSTSAGRAGFTIIELLVTVAIVAMLTALLLPAAARTVASARGFKCKMALRSVAFDFGVFADDELHGDRGTDAALAPRFRLETFIEAQYGLDEFWPWGEASEKSFPDDGGRDPMRCPGVRGDVTARRDTPCSDGALSPAANISFGFNIRLHRAQSVDRRGRPRAVPVELASDIVQQSAVPLVWDVDGAVAAERDVLPVFTGPSLDAEIYGDNTYWFPAFRHNGRMNVAFVDGHVDDTDTPLQENDWMWGYQTVR